MTHNELNKLKKNRQYVERQKDHFYYELLVCGFIFSIYCNLVPCHVHMPEPV